MGFEEPALFDDDAALLRAALGQKVDIDELRCVGWVRVPYPEDGRPWGSGVFPTPSGKVELVSATLAGMGQPALPTFVAPNEGPHGDAELHERFPLQLLTPKQHARFLNSGYSHLPKHGPSEGAPFVELDAVDASARGLVDGDVARVFNDRASLELVVRISARLRPGVVVIPFGWWTAQHADGKVANALTNDTLTEWGGGVAYSDTLVQITAR
jgi:anaerobic selenocysteine-containing dehydrogenase